VAEAELTARVAVIQERTHDLMQRAAVSIVDLLDAIGTARASGASGERLAEALALQRRAQWRLDFVNAENSMGFHADQETARVLAEAIDFARRAQIATLEH
jgi:nitrite reductase (cytochrome c-552)